MVSCGFGLDLNIGVWLFAKQYNEFCPIRNKIGALVHPASFNLTMPKICHFGNFSQERTCELNRNQVRSFIAKTIIDTDVHLAGFLRSH